MPLASCWATAGRWGISAPLPRFAAAPTPTPSNSPPKFCWNTRTARAKPSPPTRRGAARMVKFAGATCIWARGSITANRWGIFPPRPTTTAIGRPRRWMISNFPKISISPASTCRPSASGTPSSPRWSPPTARRAFTTLARTSPGCCGWCCAARRARMPSCATPKCCGTANSTPKTSARPRPPTRSSCAAATPRNSARCSRRTASATRRSSCTAT